MKNEFKYIPESFDPRWLSEDPYMWSSIFQPGALPAGVSGYLPGVGEASVPSWAGYASIGASGGYPDIDYSKILYGDPSAAADSELASLIFSGPGMDSSFTKDRYSTGSYNPKLDVSDVFNQPRKHSNISDIGNSIVSMLNAKGITYDKRTGIAFKGKNIGKYIGPAAAAFQGMQALSNVKDAEKMDNSIEDLISEIRLTANQSPTLYYDLTSDQMQLLRQLQNGSYSYDENDAELTDYMTKALSGAAMGIGGGWVGAGLGALGGLANAYTSGMSGSKEEALAELEALYQAIMLSSQEANAIRRQNALRSVPGYSSYYRR